MGAGAAPREILLEVSRTLNQNISTLSSGLAAGDADPEVLRLIRQETLDGRGRLEALRGGQGIVPELASEAARVYEHLDLMIAVADSCGSAPVLSRKLLDHLLEEQLEITREVSAMERAPSPTGAGSGELLPGDRRPLTVGSLIKR